MTLHRLALLAWLLACVPAVSAQVVDADGGAAAVAASAERKAEHSRINAERAALQKDAAQLEAACYQNFVVNSCLADIRAKRRAALAELKRQEIALNDAERKEKEHTALQGVEDRKAAQARKLTEAQQNQPTTPSAPKAPLSAVSAADRAARSEEALGRRQAENLQKQRQHADKVSAESANQKQFEAKLLEAEKRQKNRAEKAAQSKKQAVQPLPNPEK